jgi:hypothetical protein
MKNKKIWKVLLPLIIAVNIVVVVMILESARPGISQNTPESKIVYKPVKIPDTFSFAGEPMPLNRFDIRESFDRELLSNAYFHSQTIRYIKLAPRYLPVIEPILKEKGIPDDFKYLALAESGFNPRAISPARAAGFWQFLKGTAQEYGLEVNSLVDERYHIEKATRAACDYLLDSYEKFGSWTLVAASYNRGRSGIQKQLTRQKATDYYDLLITTETARYVYRIAALKIILENPEQYNFYVPDNEKYPVIKTKDVVVKGAVANFADFAKQHGISYKLLKDFNPWLRDNHLTNSKKKKYIIKIPVLK